MLGLTTYMTLKFLHVLLATVAVAFNALLRDLARRRRAAPGA